MPVAKVPLGWETSCLFGQFKTYCKPPFCTPFFDCWGHLVDPEICRNSPAKCSKKPWDHASGTKSQMNSGQNNLLIFMPYTNSGRPVGPVSVVRSSAFPNFEATHAKLGYRYRVIPCHPLQYRYLGFANPSAKPRQSKTKWIEILNPRWTPISRQRDVHPPKHGVQYTHISI